MTHAQILAAYNFGNETLEMAKKLLHNLETDPTYKMRAYYPERLSAAKKLVDDITKSQKRLAAQL